MSKLVTVIAAIAGIALISCQKKVIMSTEQKLSAGSWRVSGFVQHNEDMTEAYNDDVYQFQENGTVTVSGQHSTSGNWHVNGSSDESNEKVAVNLRFGDDLTGLSGNWFILAESDGVFQLAEELENSQFNYLTITQE